MKTREFNCAVKEYQNLVYTICYKLVQNHHIAEDLTQDTFLSAWTHWETCPQEKRKAWIARIATNKAKDHLRSAWNRKVATADDLAAVESKLFAGDMQAAVQQIGQSPELLAEAGEMIGKVKTEIEQMSPLYRPVAQMNILEDKSAQSIAKALGRPCKTVQTQIFRAKNHLRTALSCSACQKAV